MRVPPRAIHLSQIREAPIVALGLVDLLINGGETLIVGGGTTKLVKLILDPTRGETLPNRKAVIRPSRDGYRRLFSAVSCDKDLFDDIIAPRDHRRTFCHEILAVLKRRGRTLSVVSHDDQYFKVADRIVNIRYGRISV